MNAGCRGPGLGGSVWPGAAKERFKGRGEVLGFL